MQDYKRRIQRILDGICEQDKAKGKTVGWEFLEWREIAGCYEYKFRVPARYSIVDVEKVQDEIYASCGALIELDDWAGAIVVRVCKSDLPALIPFSLKMLKGLKPMECLVGFNRSGERVTFNWHHPHMIIGAETGFGKTDFIRLLTLCLLMSRAEIDIIDMKMMSFGPFKNVPDLTISRDFIEALKTLRKVSGMVYKRQEKVWELGNRKHAAKFTKRVVIIDEAADLSPALYKDDKDYRQMAQAAERYISVIARLGREVGIHLIYCTQYPTNEIVKNQIKVNCGARMCFHVDTSTQSEVILGTGGAEKLEQKGRGIFKDVKRMEVQVPYVGNDDAWERILVPFKTEVINNGSSTRSQSQRTTFEGSFRTADGQNHSAGDVLSLSSQPGQNRVETLEAIGEGKVRGRSKASKHGEGMAHDAQSTKRVRHEDAPDSFDLS